MSARDTNSKNSGFMEFDAIIHARPETIEFNQASIVRGRTVVPLRLSPPELERPFPWSFEETVDRMNCLPRMLVELDGSFVWSGRHEAIRWQLDGNLFDRHGRLLYMTVKGTCVESAWEDLLRCMGWPTARVIVQSVREAIFLEESDFRTWRLA